MQPFSSGTSRSLSPPSTTPLVPRKVDIRHNREGEIHTDIRIRMHVIRACRAFVSHSSWWRRSGNKIVLHPRRPVIPIIITIYCFHDAQISSRG